MNTPPPLRTKKPPQDLDVTERKWKIRLARAEVWQKWIIAIAGTFVAGVFYFWQADQTKSHYYAGLQSTRESSDANLRSNMFKTLFEVYFQHKLAGSKTVAKAQSNLVTKGEVSTLSSLEGEIILSDLLARNFENIDMRPMFEDLDRRLDVLVGATDHGGNPTKAEKDAFILRERLRRVAYGATSRQVLLLQSNAGAAVMQRDVLSCKSETGEPDNKNGTHALEPKTLDVGSNGSKGKSNGSKGEDYFNVRRVEDGAVYIEGPISTKEGLTQAASPSLTVTFFDMPSLENVRLSDGRRAALTLTRYASTDLCRRFRTDVVSLYGKDSEAEDFCKAVLKEGKNCAKARITMTILPKGFVGFRDRPYLGELSQGADTPLTKLREMFDEHNER